MDEAQAVDAPKILPEDFHRPKAIDRPEKPDDLKLISGVGPKLEQVLNGLGVWTFAQIAGWTAEEVAWVDDYLAFAGRIGRDDWLKQAAELAGKAG
jgi:NADH-quinone oxidoreductase subunit E